MKDRVNVIQESYKHYRFKNERYKVSADYEEYKKVANKLFERLFEAIVTSGLEFELPSKLGVMVLEQYDTEKYIKKLEEKGKHHWATDKKTQIEYFKRYGHFKKIPYDSSETEGRMWTYSWLRSKKGTFRQKSFYSFNLVRSNIRSTSNSEYSEKSKRLTIHDFYKETGYKIYRNLIRIRNTNSKDNAHNTDDSSGISS